MSKYFLSRPISFTLRHPAISTDPYWAESVLYIHRKQLEWLFRKSKWYYKNKMSFTFSRPNAVDLHFVVWVSCTFCSRYLPSLCAALLISHTPLVSCWASIIDTDLSVEEVPSLDWIVNSSCKTFHLSANTTHYSSHDNTPTISCSLIQLYVV
jgi:hypothetical protein